tara:strand:+ start:2648 stop:3811 length:1164 start_codon:yes stop_codon:yes gene_type:complete
MIIALLLSLFIIGIFIFVVRKKEMQTWLPTYVKQGFFPNKKFVGPKHIMFCFVDHYEPQWMNKDNINLERERVDRWMTDYPIMAAQYTDADGYHPKHSFFFPEEEYRKEHLDKLSDLCARGFGEIEIHLHHENDTSDNLRATLTNFAELLYKDHGALSLDPETGKPTYAFIHGNWALDNSHAHGHWCGVNDELIILKETGCYADFTFPSPDTTQPAMVNCIYYAKDDPVKPKSYNKGRKVKKGGSSWGDLMIVQGVLKLNWQNRKFGIIPKIEQSDVRNTLPPSKERVDMWVDQAIHIENRPDWIFIKVHTHGTQETSMETLLGKPINEMHQHLNAKYNDGKNYFLHYVSSREMYNIIKAAEDCKKGNPNDYRNFVIPKPEFKRSPI